jgi:hypothetical protein
LYEPLSYNNGAVWPFVTGYATMALYSQDRPEAGWTYLQALGDLAFVDSCGYSPELLSGDRFRAVDAAVPHQLFATMGFMSGFARGLLGLRQPVSAGAGVDSHLLVRPQLPPEWREMTVKNLRWREHKTDLRIARVDGSTSVTMSPPIASIDVGTPTSTTVRGPASRTAGRIEYQPLHAPLRAGQASERLRILQVQRTATLDRVRYEGRAGVTYSIAAHGDPAITRVAGAAVVSREAARTVLHVTPSPGPLAWARGEFTVERPAAVK